MINEINADVVIIGGGIAGLWLFRMLNIKGYKAVLLENNRLGSGQTSKSQGIIHGGTKYTLSGNLTKASQCISGMPDRWLNALTGRGELDLSHANVLSHSQYLWSPGGLGSRLTTFFASKALRGKVSEVTPSQRPTIFQHNDFNGKMYQLSEMVLDIHSVIKALIAGLENRCIKVHWNSNTQLRVRDQTIESINIQQGGKSFKLKAQRYIVTAGEGAADFMRLWGISKPQMQTRPLHMVMVKHSHPDPIFAHCIGTHAVPRMTITTHPTQDNQWIWYLGGEIAEEGVKKSTAELIVMAKRELSELFPWVNIAGGEWRTLRVNRAEPKQRSLFRPDAAFCEPVSNGIIAWPTKLALAPNLSDEVIKILNASFINPSSNNDFHLPECLVRPELSSPFWSGHFD